MRRLLAALAILFVATAANAETITRQALAQALKNLTGSTGIGGATVTITTGGTDRWTVNASGDFNPVTNNAYSIGNGLTNPKDVTAARNLQLFNGATLTTSGFYTLDSTGNLIWKAYTLASGAPSAALAGAGAGNVDNGTHVYVETCVTAGGETYASAASAAVTVADKTVDGKVTVTLSVAPPCGAFTTGRNLYRSKAGTTTPLYLVAASPVVADNTTATYTDNVADAALQATTAPTTNSAADSRVAVMNGGSFRLTSSGRVGWAAALDPTAAADTSLRRISAGLTGVTSDLSPDSAALTAGTLTVTNSALLRQTITRFDWTNAMITALGATGAGDLTVCTLPAKTVVRNAYVVIDSADTSANALTVALGRTSATYIDYIVASDAKAAANTVYGDASAERGTNLTGYDLPSVTGTTAVKLHFIKTTSNLSTVLNSTGHVYLETEVLP